MNKSEKIFFLLVLSIFIFSTVTLIGCSQSPSPAGSSSASSVSSSSASSLQFINVDGNTLFISRGNPSSENGTITNINGRDCIMIKGLSVADGGNYVLEAQWDLTQPLNMSGGNYIIDFDIYVPADTIAFRQGLQFAFYETPSYTPIYSRWWVGSIVADQWINRQAIVNVGSQPLVDGFIDYSGFVNNPDDWTNMTKVRIQYVGNAQTNFTFFIGKIAGLFLFLRR